MVRPVPRRLHRCGGGLHRHAGGRGGRVGNRWAWLWVFAGSATLGAVLFLVLEPVPLWQRGRRPAPSQPIVRGGAGAIIGVVLASGFGLARIWLFNGSS